MNWVKYWFNELNIFIYNEKIKIGLICYLVVRIGYYIDEMMVIFVINGVIFK